VTPHQFYGRHRHYIIKFSLNNLVAYDSVIPRHSCFTKFATKVEFVFWVYWGGLALEGVRGGVVAAWGTVVRGSSFNEFFFRFCSCDGVTF